MKLDSKYFDRIRVKPEGDGLGTRPMPKCNWSGCEKPGTHRAPKGRGLEGEYHLFCLDHVRDYNKSYNYFSGMNDADVASYQKASMTGHRPTWSSGVNAWAATGFKSAAQGAMGGFTKDFQTHDPFGFFNSTRHGGGADFEPEKPQRVIRNAERKSFSAMGLSVDASPSDIKARFKLLVKRHHPDANGGDRGTEDRLREIIQAYNYLKQAGFC